jgi:murein tripeptide amidase MpaA
MAYLNVDEIEAALEALAASHPSVTELVPLPHRTSEGRQSHALRIGPPDAQGANVVVITGGLHAREWVPPDALVNLAADLIEAHSGGSGLRYGGQRFSADDIRGVVEGLQLVLFPCVNPDGRHHSQTSAEVLWRKNRRRVSPGLGPGCVGVDINRNFDVLWDFRRHFAPDSRVSASDDPCDFQVYVGPAAASEAETRNVVSLLDRYQRAHWFVDVHSHVPAIFYNWGFDENQTSDPSMSFRNAAFDGQRGRVDNAYREFIPPEDLQALKELGGKMNDAVTAASGTGYDLAQSFTLYPTSGVSDDYAYSRHFVDGASSKILSFTIECGRSFQPPWAEAENVIREVCAGLIALCVAARAQAVRAAAPSA